MFDPNKVPSGLSWGVRGFRVGKSSFGNWWISVGLPFGFRYTWMLGKNPVGKNTPKIEEIPQSEGVNEVIESPVTSNQLKTHNEEILNRMKK